MKRLAAFAFAFIPFHALAAAQIPLEKGAFWNYTANVSWTTVNSSRVNHAVIHWQTKVLDAVNSSQGTTAIVSGFPNQLAWYEPGTKPGLDVVVETANGLWINPVKSQAEAQALLRSIVDGEVMNGGQQYLENPLRIGDCFAADDPGRHDGFYCWKVLRRIADNYGNRWEMAYRTVADRMTIQYAPGIGIICLSYEHHGTVASSSARLESYHPADK